MALPTKNFLGKLNDKTIYDFSLRLDKKINKYENRLKKVQEILIKEVIPCEVKNGKDYEVLDDYFVEYFDSYFKVNVTCGDFLSVDNNICREIEKMASYILNGVGCPNHVKKTKYKYRKYDDMNNLKNYKSYTEDEIMDKSKKYISIDTIVESEEFDREKYSEILYFIERPTKNYKKEKTQKIFTEDLDSIQIIKEYNMAKKRLIRKVQKIKKQTNYLKQLENKTEEQKQNIIDNQKHMYLISSHIKDFTYDMILCKDKINGTIYFKHLCSDSTKGDMYLFNFTDVAQIEKALRHPMSSLLNEDGIVMYDLQKTLERCNLSKSDVFVLKNVRNGIKFKVLAENLGCDIDTISKRIKFIAKTVVKKYKEIYEDWFNLNYIKGKYKKCSKCGEVKLVSGFYEHPETSDGYENSCKICKKSNA